MKNDYLCNKKKIVFQNLYNQLNVTTFAVRNRVIHSLGRSALLTAKPLTLGNINSLLLLSLNRGIAR